MTEVEIKRLPYLINKDKMSLTEIARMFDCHINTVTYWVKRLREKGVVLNVKKGPPFKKI